MKAYCELACARKWMFVNKYASLSIYLLIQNKFLFSSIEFRFYICIDTKYWKTIDFVLLYRIGYSFRYLHEAHTVGNHSGIFVARRKDE